MPCNDITDILTLLLSPDGNLARYSLHKLSCGGAVGHESMLQNLLTGKSAEDILAIQPADILEDLPAEETAEQYLRLKHMLSIQTGLAIILGKDSGGIEDFCTVEAVRHSPAGIELIAHLDVSGLSDQIEACGYCSQPVQE